MELRRISGIKKRALREREINARERKTGEMNRLCAVLAVILGLIAIWIASLVSAWYMETQKQRELADQMLRFHVIADSDSAQDQTRKREVRDALLQYLQEQMPADAFAEQGQSAEDAEDWIRTHIDEIEQEAEETLRHSGSEDTVHAAVVTCWFPDRWQEERLFPAGNYRALRVEIGSAGGRNWWGVLCPGLCFRDSVRVVYPDGRRRWLLDELSAEAYSDVTALTEFKIKWYLWEGTGE